MALIAGGNDDQFYADRYAPMLQPAKPDLTIELVPVSDEVESELRINRVEFAYRVSFNEDRTMRHLLGCPAEAAGYWAFSARAHYDARWGRGCVQAAAAGQFKEAAN
jgi:hypothetical protein